MKSAAVKDCKHTNMPLCSEHLERDKCRAHINEPGAAAAFSNAHFISWKEKTPYYALNFLMILDVFITTCTCMLKSGILHVTWNRWKRPATLKDVFIWAWAEEKRVTESWVGNERLFRPEKPFMMCLSCMQYVLRATGGWKLICHHGRAENEQ